MIYINSIENKENIFELIIPAKNGDIKRFYPKDYKVEVISSEDLIVKTIDTLEPLTTSFKYNEVTVNNVVPTSAFEAQQLIAEIVFKKGGKDGGGSGSEIEVIDNLESTSTTDALSANKGKELNDTISSINRDLSNSSLFYSPNQIIRKDSDIQWIDGGFINTAGGITLQSGYSYQKDYIPVIPNATFLYKGMMERLMRFNCYNESGEYIGITAAQQSVVQSISFTTPNNCYFLKICKNNKYTPTVTYTGTEKIYPLLERIDLNTSSISPALDLGVFPNQVLIKDSTVEWVDGGYIGKNGEIVQRSGYSYQKGLTPVTSNTAYLFTGRIESGVRIACFNKNETLIGAVGEHSNIATSLPFVTPEECAFIKVSKTNGYPVYVTLSTNAQIPKNVYISNPKKIIAVVGDKLEIFKHSIMNAINSDNYFLKMIISPSIVGVFYDRSYEYKPTAVTGSRTVSFRMYNDNSELISQGQNMELITVAKKVSPTKQTNVLLIGDSYTDADYYPAELRRRLTGVGGFVTAPAADNLSNINFIGTRNKSGKAEAPYREGYSSQYYSWFYGSSSPFYNPSTATIDFDYYMETKLIPNYGATQNLVSGDKIDIAVIILGRNKQESDIVISKMWDALLVHNPNMKILVGGMIPAVEFGGPGKSNQTTFELNKPLFPYNRRIEKLAYSEKYKDNVLYVDVAISLDALFNMPYSQVPVNARNSETIKRGTDNVHPADSGYYQIADAMYRAFHYFCLE